ncbi:iron complex outermembrane recepter protein [Tistlia consotensis]|uniref:Iron complex outermembrane recepter protein n=2 Tax=Tistlia TaxID=1321364 RepID=A0A1Y6C8B6_9PROT|nr:iron complex outermembrane recepter protein [Tistlia consotensis USBA 355]SNR81744.1 iron complex outermembrane recepter protein [Tistlia consotensis]
MAVPARLGTGLALALTLGGTAAAEGPGLAAFFPSLAATAQQLAQAAQPLDFAIPPQPLDKAVIAFARRAGLQVFYDTAKLKGLESPGVRGRFTAEDALARLLEGTGVTWRFTEPGTVALERVAADGNSLVLNPIRVEGEGGAPATATIGTLPPAYAGGQVARGGRIGALGNQDRMEVPFAITSYTEETIRNQQAETIGEVLANDASVRTSYGYGNFSESFVIRGFPLSGEDIAIDGLYGTAPRQIVNTEMYERVELLTGASAFLNGMPPAGSGIGGTVNLVPKRAGDAPLTRLTGSWAQDSRFGGHLDFGRRFGADKEFGLRSNVVARDGETAIEDETRSTLLGSLALDYRGERARVTLDLASQRQRVDQGRPVVFVSGTAVPDATDASANYATAWSYSELTDTYGQIRAEYDLTDRVTAHAALGARSLREDGDYASPTVTGSNGSATVGRLTVPREDQTKTGELGLNALAETGPVGHRLSLGATALDTVNRNSYEFASSQATNLYDPADVARPATLLASGDFDDLPKVAETTTQSFYLADTLTFFDDRLLFTAGLRRQHIQVEGFDRSSGTRTANFDEWAWTPAFGLVFRPTETLSLYANRIEGLTPSDSAPATAVNAGEVFAPYRSTQYEIGGKLDFGTLGGSLALFQTTRPSGLTDPDTLVYGIDGEQRNRGIELSLFGEPLEGFRLLGGVTLLDAELARTAGGSNDGNDAVGVPDYQFNIGAEWDLPYLRGLTLTGRLLHTGPQYLDAANSLEVPAWTRLDLGARYRTELAGYPVAFLANIENVTDNAYWASANGGYLTQGAPLTAKLSVSLDF